MKEREKCLIAQGEQDADHQHSDPLPVIASASIKVHGELQEGFGPRRVDYANVQELPENIRDSLGEAHYEQITMLFYEDTGKKRIDLHHLEPMDLDSPFQPLTVDEGRLLTTGTVDAIEKYFRFKNLPGYLHVGYYFEPASVFFEPCVSPWQEQDLTKDDATAYPITVGMCFNETPNATPRFDLRFPEAPHNHFLGLVTDWGTGDQVVERSFYDATLYIYEHDDIQGNGVELYLPWDEEKLAAMRITAASDFTAYPQSW